MTTFAANNSKTPDWLLLSVAILFHIVGLVGIGILHHDGIQKAAPWHMLLMAGLLLFSFRKQAKHFSIWVAAVALICLAAEWIGIHYGWIFGGYWYGNVLGIKWQNVPLIIGLNWSLVTAGAISISERIPAPKWGIILLAATLATAYDWLLEPVAIKLRYWDWHDGQIPPYNYLCWWGLSVGSTWFWARLGLRGNFFARGLFIIQIIFFILLRILL